MTSTISMMMAMLAWATGARADGLSAKADPVRVQICYVPHGVHLDGIELSMAQTKASQLLAEAGIRLEWRSGKTREGEKGVHVIPLKFLLAAPENLSKKGIVLAETTLSGTGGAIAMFDDRITFYLSFCRPADRWKVLGHILAHEIVHVLEGIARHSEAGLMKALWTGQDLRSMTGAGLGLAGEDRELLRALFLPTLTEAVSARRMLMTKTARAEHTDHDRQR
jgi:hypothetical protein